MYDIAKKIILAVLTIAVLAPAVVFAAPSSVDRLTDHIEPLIKTDYIKAQYFTATSTSATSTLPRVSIQTALDFFGTYANSLDDLCVAITGSAGLCDGNDASGGGGGSGNVATSTGETAGNLAYWTSTNGTPATLGKVATSSVTINAPLTSAGTPGAVVGGSGWTLDVDDIGAADLANADFGDFSCNGTTCTVDADSIALATDTTGNYVATVSSSGSITVGNSGSENAAVTVNLNMGNANTWTALQTFTNASTTGYHSFGTASSTNWTGGGLTDCDADNQTVSYDVTTQKFGCGDDDTGAGGSGSMTTTKEGNVQVGDADIVTLDFGSGFDLVESPDTEVNISLDLLEYNGAASTTLLSANQFWAGQTATTSVTSGGDLIVGGGDLTIGGTAILTGGDTTSLDNIDAINATTESTIEAAIDTLANLTSVQGQTISLSAPFTLAADPNADRFLFWDDSAGGTAYLAPDGTLSISGTTLSVVDVTCTDCLGTTEIADSYLLNNGDAGTGVYDFGGATSFEIPNGTGPTVNTTGQFALDTTDNQLIGADSGGNARVFARAEQSLFAVTVASTSIDFATGGLMEIPKWTSEGRELTRFVCHVDGGTSKVMSVTDGTNDTETITCGTTATIDTDVATNDTFTANELWKLKFGATTGSVDYVTFEALGYITPE